MKSKPSHSVGKSGTDNAGKQVAGRPSEIDVRPTNRDDDQELDQMPHGGKTIVENVFGQPVELAVPVSAETVRQRLDTLLQMDRKRALRDGGRIVVVDLAQQPEIDLASYALDRGVLDVCERVLGE